MTDFEKKVLQATLTIPLGEVRSYRWVARRAGKPKAWRAAANALNKNPYPVFIPCHRVVKSDGSPGGYAKGVRLKKELIKVEKIIKNVLK